MNQNRTVDVLREVYQSAKTAMDAINMIIPKARTGEFKNALEQQLDRYHNIADEATIQLQGYRELPNDTDIFTKLGVWSSVKMNTLTNQNTEHMAEIMINGSTLGIVDMTKFVRANEDISVYSRDLANRLIDIEHDNITIMKEFL